MCHFSYISGILKIVRGNECGDVDGALIKCQVDIFRERVIGKEIRRFIICRTTSFYRFWRQGRKYLICDL